MKLNIKANDEKTGHRQSEYSLCLSTQKGLEGQVSIKQPNVPEKPHIQEVLK